MTICIANNRALNFASWHLKFSASYHSYEMILGNPNKYLNGKSIKHNYGNAFYDLVTLNEILRKHFV